MSTVEKKTSGVGGKDGISERTAKSAVTRQLTAEKRSKLSAEANYAYSKVSACRRALDAMGRAILGGEAPTGALLAACAEIERQIGLAMFK